MTLQISTSRIVRCEQWSSTTNWQSSTFVVSTDRGIHGRTMLISTTMANQFRRQSLSCLVACLLGSSRRSRGKKMARCSRQIFCISRHIFFISRHIFLSSGHIFLSSRHIFWIFCVPAISSTSITTIHVRTCTITVVHSRYKHTHHGRAADHRHTASYTPTERERSPYTKSNNYSKAIFCIKSSSSSSRHSWKSSSWHRMINHRRRAHTHTPKTQARSYSVIPNILSSRGLCRGRGCRKWMTAIIFMIAKKKWPRHYGKERLLCCLLPVPDGEVARDRKRWGWGWWLLLTIYSSKTQTSMTFWIASFPSSAGAGGGRGYTNSRAVCDKYAMIKTRRRGWQ